MQYSLLYNMLQGISAPSLFTKGSLARGEKNTEPYCQSDISLQTVLIPVTLEIEGIKNIYKKNGNETMCYSRIVQFSTWGR